MPYPAKRTIDSEIYTGTAGQRCVLWDDAQPGFGLRVYPSGRKSFLLSHRPSRSSTKRLLKLGNFGTLTVDEARQRARRHLVSISDGRDPLIERKVASVPALPPGDLATRWVEDYAKLRRRHWKIDRWRIEKHVRPALGAIPRTRITKTQIRSLHAKIGATAPVMA
jgi:hypothetical protein